MIRPGISPRDTDGITIGMTLLLDKEEVSRHQRNTDQHRVVLSVVNGRVAGMTSVTRIAGSISPQRYATILLELDETDPATIAPDVIKNLITRPVLTSRVNEKRTRWVAEWSNFDLTAGSCYVFKHDVVILGLPSC
jgi:hypothetical protein